MALCGIGVNSSLDGVELRCLSPNSSIRLIRTPISAPFAKSFRTRCFRFRCRAYRNAVSAMESEQNDQVGQLVSDDVELGPVTRFRMDDFVVSDRVSVGLGGKAYEVVFEAVVKNTNSPLYNTRVVLRELTSAQAQRRGRRAIEVLRKLARRKLLYHSYSMQVHGFVSPTSGNGGSFTLVHGYHGSFSLRHWLQQ